MEKELFAHYLEWDWDSMEVKFEINDTNDCNLKMNENNLVRIHIFHQIMVQCHDGIHLLKNKSTKEILK